MPIVGAQTLYNDKGESPDVSAANTISLTVPA